MANNTPEGVLDLEALERELEMLTSQYECASPFPHIVIEDFLPPAVVASAIAEFLALDLEHWNPYSHANERKFSQTEPQTWGLTLQSILSELNSERFVSFLGSLT